MLVLIMRNTTHSPCKDVWNTKDKAGVDDVEEITEGKDSHELVEVVPLIAEPDDEQDITNQATQTNQNLPQFVVSFEKKALK